jgi:hypothetical protein
MINPHAQLNTGAADRTLGRRRTAVALALLVATIASPSFPEARGQLFPDIADFRRYPNATLVGSAQQNRADQPTLGYRIKWTTNAAAVSTTT